MCAAQNKQEEAEAEERSSQEVDMGAYARKHARYDKGPEREANGALSVLWHLWELHRIGEIFRICPTGIVEEQAEKRPILLADMEEI